MMKKLVRDRIPELVPGTYVRVSSSRELFEMLKRKLVEEVMEFLESDNIEELADILEVVEALARMKGVEWQKLIEIKEAKRRERGGFEKGYILIAKD